MKILLCILFLIIFCDRVVFAQDSLRRFPIGITLDYQALKNRSSYSLGFGWMYYQRNTQKNIKEGVRIEAEYYPGYKYYDQILGLKMMGSVSSKFHCAGLGVGYFGNDGNYKIAFIPEVGLGYKSIFFVYRRNMSLFHHGIVDINKNNLSIRLYIPCNKKWFKIKN